MSRGSLLGPALVLTTLITITNGISCCKTLNRLDECASIEVVQKEKEDERWFKGFPFDQIHSVVEGYGEKFAYQYYINQHQ